MVPGQADRPRGCLLSPRCPHVVDACRAAHPSLTVLPDGGAARCIRPRHMEGAS
jgi:dipeptide transport system ATP-binding protein